MPTHSAKLAIAGHIAPAPIADSPLSHINNARQVVGAMLEERRLGEMGLVIDQALSAVEFRLKQAVEQLQAEPDRMAALQTIDGLKDELASLRDDLRDSQEQIAQHGKSSLHLRVDWERDSYIVERRWPLGRHSDWSEAKAHVRRLLAEGKTIIDDTNGAAVLRAFGDQEVALNV